MDSCHVSRQFLIPIFVVVNGFTLVLLLLSRVSIVPKNNTALMYVTDRLGYGHMTLFLAPSYGPVRTT